jgi:iron complex transport system permease protein
MDINFNMTTPARVVRVSSALAAVFVALSAVSLGVGAAKIDVMGLIRDTLAGLSLSESDRAILFSIRLPRIIFAGMVGASLSAAGVVFQALLRNPLADPYILGISGGAALGGIIGIILGSALGSWGIPGLSFLGAVLTIFLVFGIAGKSREPGSNTLLLAGVIVNAFFSALIMFVIATSGSASLPSILSWMMGDLSVAGEGRLAASGLILVFAFGLIYYHSKSLNMIVTGEETARHLGVPVERTKRLLLVAASLITAAAVSVSGIIGFVGLIIPHMMRIVFGSDHRVLLPASFFFGASFLLIADTIARTAIAPAELPVGVITALCGAPYFIYLLRRKGAF